MSAAPIPVTIRGTSYPSMSVAARAIGLTLSAVCQARRHGKLDSVGLRPLKTTALVWALSRATPDNLPQLREEAAKWLRHHDIRSQSRRRT